MAKLYNVTKTPTNLDRYEKESIRERAEIVNAKNDRIVGAGYAERQIADTLSKVEPIDVHVSKIGHNMEDLVKRGHVVEAIAKYFATVEDLDEWREWAAEIVADVPKVKTTPRGHCIRDTDLNKRAPGLIRYFCSCCSTYNDTRSNYCPNCGASRKGKR